MHIDTYRNVQEACRFCLMCRHTCTVGNHTFAEVDTPRARGLLLQNIERGLQDVNEELADVIYKCCLCGYCKQWCVTHFDAPELVKAARRDLVEQDMVPENIKNIKNSLIAKDNPFGVGEDCESAEMKEIIKEFSADQEILLYTGATARYLRPEIVLAAVKILKKAGVKFAVMPREIDNGFMLNALGYVKEATEKAGTLLKTLRGKGIEKVIVLSSEDYYQFTKVYADLGIDTIGIEFVHISQLLKSMIDDKQLQLNPITDKVLTYHDSAYAARFASIIEEPRVVLKSIVKKLVEMDWSRELAHSAGEGLLVINPDLSKRIAMTRLHEANEKKVDVIVVSSPECKESLLRASGPESNILIKDLVEIVAENVNG